jgi:hypothetical protein
MNFGKKNKQYVKQGIHYCSLKMVTAGLFERLINFYQNTRRGVPTYSRHRSHCGVNLSVTDSEHSHSGITWRKERLLGHTQPSLHGYGGSFPGAKRPGHEVYLSPLSSTEIKRVCCTSVPRIFLHKVYTYLKKRNACRDTR